MGSGRIERSLRLIRSRCLLWAVALVCARGALAAEPKESDPAGVGAGSGAGSKEAPAGWRGDGGGKYLAATPPLKWSATENVTWRADVGAGASPPLLVGSRVFVTSEPDLLVCVDAQSGRELWRKAHKVADFPASKNAKSPIRPNEYGDANPAPVSDGRSVWAFYGPGIVACYDLDGTKRWAEWYDFRQMTQYGRTASPVLVGDRLLVHFGPLVARDAGTGTVVWKCDGAKATYGTPARARIGDVEVVVTPRGDVVRVSDGKVLASDLGRCMYTSPVVQGRTVYFVDRSASAVQLPEKAGEQIETKELWFEDLSGEFYASPVAHEGRIYAVNRSAEYFVIEAATGKTLLKKTLDLPPAGRNDSPNIYPSVCLAGKHLLVGNDAGETALMEPGEDGKVVGTSTLPAGSGSTPVFSGARMFVRGGSFLYCVEARK